MSAMGMLRQRSPFGGCVAPKAALTLRAMNVQELAEEYRHKADKELLRLALTPDQLTPEAYHALTAELASRGIGSDASLEAARQDEAERKAENDRELGTLGLVVPIGVGRMRFGRANGIYDPNRN